MGIKGLSISNFQAGMGDVGDIVIFALFSLVLCGCCSFCAYGCFMRIQQAAPDVVIVFPEPSAPPSPDFMALPLIEEEEEPSPLKA